MQRIRLGETKLRISRLCYGTEPFTLKKGPPGKKSQGDIEPKEGGRRLREAHKLGVNFWDTADDYGTHPHVANALEGLVRRNVVVADKTNAALKKEGWAALENCLKELNTEYIDLMFLHIVPPRKMRRTDSMGLPYVSYPLKERKGALKAFLEAKDTGQVKATALSTHDTGVLKELLEEPEIDVVCTTLNKSGDFIEGGAISEHLEAIQDLKDMGKGIYVVKVLSAGRLFSQAENAIKYVLQFHDFIDAWNIGMYGIEDVKRNLSLFKEILG